MLSVEERRDGEMYVAELNNQPRFQKLLIFIKY